MKRNTTLTEDKLRHHYLVEKLTETEIGELYGMSQGGVSYRRRKFGIETILKSDRLDLPGTLTPRQTSLLLGSMLGDGGIRCSGEDTAIVYESHCDEQRGYLEWKMKEWGEFIVRISDNKHPKGYKGATFETHASRLFQPYRKMFYPTGSGYKTFVNLDPTTIDDFALAVWFMDDGSRSEHYARLHVSPLEQNQEVQLRVLENFGLRGTIYVDSSDGDASIHIDGRTDYQRFLDLIVPHIRPEFHYKLDVKPGRGGLAPRDALTKERLQAFYDRGLTRQEVSEVTGHSKTSVSRISKQFGFAPGHTGRQRRLNQKEHSVEEATNLLGKLNPMAADYVDRAVEVLSLTTFPVEEISEQELKHDIALLIACSTHVQEGTIQKISKGGSKACKYWFPHIWSATNREGVSAIEAWYDVEQLRRAVNYQLASGDPVLPNRVFRALSMNVRAPTNFRPSYAKALVKELCPLGGSVLDPCAGYGGRAAGTLAAGRRYIGVDPHPEAAEPMRLLHEFMGGVLEFHNTPFEDTELGDLKVDLVLTSPPYFSVERYSNETTQSWIRYRTWESWVDNFLSVLVRKSSNHLNPGGCLCINTKNVSFGGKVYPIADELLKLASANGLILEQEIKLPMGTFGNPSKFELAYVFRKPSV